MLCGKDLKRKCMERKCVEPQGCPPPMSVCPIASKPASTLPNDAQELHERDGPGEAQSEEVQLLPKHRIFLSYSGAQKPFVEQLCEDLENAGHFPFFDRRPESLPKGEKFPYLILEAARECRVAVVVLSMEYLESKWPMLELIEFAKASTLEFNNLKILPLFYKIGVEHLKYERERDRIALVWHGHSVCPGEGRSMPTTDDCLRALKMLAGINGEVFSGESELAYRRAIVASICKLCPPEVHFDVSVMQGRNRLCDAVVAEFDNLSTKGMKARGAHARVVGVYGVGGTGKTLLCKALCNTYYEEFPGRVLHVELKGYKDLKLESITEAQKKILEGLTDASPLLLRRISSVEQGNAILRDILPRKNVFLALDNVHEGISEYIQILLRFLSPRSKAIVTSRSLQDLKSVLEGKPHKISLVSQPTCPSELPRLLSERPFTSGHLLTVESIPREKIAYMQIPTLQKDEALKIFLRHALAPTRLLSPFSVEESEVLEICIKRCFYLNKDPLVIVLPDSCPAFGHYHPLSLQALGSYLKGIDSQEPLQWMQKSKILHEKKLFYMNSVFDTLRASYDALSSEQDKLIFLDIAAFAPRGKLNNLHDLCNWLGAIHNMDLEETLHKVKNLRRNSLIEDWEKNETLKVTVHDLYVEFAEHQINLEESQRWCVYERGGRTLPSALKSEPPGMRWSSLVRLRLHTASVISFPLEKLREWANLVVLDINLVMHKSFDISPLKCLRSLKLKSFTLETLTWSSNMEELRYVKLSCERLLHVPDFSPCSNLLELNMRVASAAAVRHQKRNPLDRLLGAMATTLKVLQLTCWNPEFSEFLVLGTMPNLEVVEIVNDLGFCEHEGSFLVASLSPLTQLRRLALKNLAIRGSLPGLENLVSLESLLLNRCQELNDLPGLGKLTNLQRLDVSSTAIEVLAGLENLSQLRGLYLVNCSRLRFLPDLKSFPSLKEVFTMGCTSLLWQDMLVSGSCTLISGSLCEEILWIWAKFLNIFYRWTGGSSKVDFQRVLRHCLTAAEYEQGLGELEGLEELSAAFQEAFSMMHDMAWAGRTKQEFDPETDLVICSKIVSIIPKYRGHLELRISFKSWFDFEGYARKLEAMIRYKKVPRSLSSFLFSKQK